MWLGCSLLQAPVKTTLSFIHSNGKLLHNINIITTRTYHSWLLFVSCPAFHVWLLLLWSSWLHLLLKVCSTQRQELQSNGITCDRACLKSLSFVNLCLRQPSISFTAQPLNKFKGNALVQRSTENVLWQQWMDEQESLRMCWLPLWLTKLITWRVASPSASVFSSVLSSLLEKLQTI